MSDMGTKFSVAAAALNNTIKRVFVGALREGLAEGFSETVQSTRQDSSNAVVHWMLGATDGSNAAGRAMAAPTDLRATIKHGAKHPWVGRRGDNRSGTGVAIATADKVLAREVKIAIDRYARGQLPATNFYFYNVFLDNPLYSGRAELEKAANIGLARAVAVFDREIALGNERRYRLK